MTQSQPSELMPNIESSTMTTIADTQPPITEQSSNDDTQSVAVENDDNSGHSNDILDVDLVLPGLTDEESISHHSPMKSVIKSEPIDNSTDLLLNEDLRLQIEKSIELVVNEFARSTDCVTENVSGSDEPMETSVSDTIATEITPSEEQSLENLVENRDAAYVAENVPCNSNVTSSCTKNDVAELPPKIPNDITVIPLNTSKTISIKSEPRDGAVEADRKFKKSSNESVSNRNETNPVHRKSIYLPSLANSKHSSLTIVPVTSGSTPVKYILPDSVPAKMKIRSDSGEFSISSDVTIKTIPSTTSTSSTGSLSMMDPPKPLYGPETKFQTSSQAVRSSSLPNDYLGLPITPPQIFSDHGLKSDMSSSSNACSTFTPKCCSYKPSSVTSNSMANLSCSYPSSACTSESCIVPGQTPAALPQCQQSSSLALMPYTSQPSSFCSNFNSFAQTPSPLSSPKHLKPPINTLSSCRMSSSSPIPAYMRSREPSYSAPILCDSFAATRVAPPESPSFRLTPPWNTPPSSFRNSASSATFNCTLPSPSLGPIAPPPPSHSVPSSQAMFPSCNNQSNSLVLPMPQHHQKSVQNPAYPFRSSFTPGCNSNPQYPRAQCCFSSQVQCFNSACTSSSQQQFSIVQHSSRLSNLKSNSADSVSSLLQYHTYFKKY